MLSSGWATHLIAQDVLVLAQRDPGVTTGELRLVAEVGLIWPPLKVEVFQEGVFVRQATANRGVGEKLKDRTPPRGGSVILLTYVWNRREISRKT